MKAVLRSLLLLLIVCPVSLIALPRIAYVGMSGILPGSGEISLGKVNRGAVFMSADLVSIALFAQTKKDITDLDNSYRELAGAYAGAATNVGGNYFQHLQNWRSSDEFNRYQQMMARNYFLISNYDPAAYDAYIAANTYSDDEAWAWENDSQWSQYRKTRTKYQEAKLYNNMVLGTLLLNRIVSMLDVVFIKNQVGTQNLYFSPDNNLGLRINYQMEF